MSFYRFRFAVYVLLASLSLNPAAFSGEEKNTTLIPGIDYAQVTLDGRELFPVRGISMFTAEKRAGIVGDKIRWLAKDASFTTNLVTMAEDTRGIRIMGGDVEIMLLVGPDAELIGLEHGLAAELVTSQIRMAITEFRAGRQPDAMVRQLVRAIALTLITAGILYALMRIHRRIYRQLESRIVSTIKEGVKIQSFSVVRREQIWRVIEGFMDLVKILIIIAVAYIYLQRLLNIFPWTRHAGAILLDWLMAPLRTFWHGLLDLMPNLVFLVVLYLVVRYILRLIHSFFTSVAAGAIRLKDFESEWAMPTFRIIRLFILIFALVIAYPYIPGSNTDAFKGISVFVGIVFSLGSSSLIANIIAGYTLIYRKAFHAGDRIRVGDQMGIVDEVRLMVTRLRSYKNEEIIIPNSQILNQDVINYSSLAQRDGLILYTTVGIGYETPWRQVEAMLLEAAARTKDVEKEPPPFIRQNQNALGDFAVMYEINVFCRNVERVPLIYTDLHRNILDVFNEYGVQIMTPAYEDDAEQPKIVPREQWYAEPAKKPDDQSES